MNIKAIFIIGMSLIFSTQTFSCDFSGCGCTGCYRALDMSDVMGYQPVAKRTEPCVNLYENVDY